MARDVADGVRPKCVVQRHSDHTVGMDGEVRQHPLRAVGAEEADVGLRGDPPGEQAGAEARAQGIHVAAGLRVSSGTAILSTLLLLLAAPTIGFGQHGVVWALVSTIVSMLLSLLMTVLLWKAIVTATRVPLKHWLGLLSPKLGRHYSDTTDRAVKMVLVLGVAAILFWLGEQLERLPASDRPVVVRPLNGTGVLTLMYAPSPALWGPPFALTFQPWACCFFASFLLCNTENAPQPSAASRRSLADYGPREAARRELERQQRVKSDWIRSWLVPHIFSFMTFETRSSSLS